MTDTGYPQFSFVVTARNDNYGGDLLRRVNTFLGVFAVLAAKHNLSAELLIVEWNPPKDRARLCEAITWPNQLNAGTVRIIEVPHEVHAGLPNAKRIPLFEYIGKNVGIRRARGRYVLTTNPDILFSEPLIKHLAAKTLSQDCFYRVNRYDVEEVAPTGMAVEDRLQWCRRRACRVWLQSGCVPVQQPAERWVKSLKDNVSRLSPHRVSAGLLHRSRRREENQADVAQEPVRPAVHCNASGDFMLMARDRWIELGGFPEFATHSHIDSFMCYLAAFSGLSQVVWPYPIYHQEHGREECNSRPLTELGDLWAFVEKCSKEGVVKVNDSGWGLNTARLPVWESPGGVGESKELLDADAVEQSA